MSFPRKFACVPPPFDRSLNTRDSDGAARRTRNNTAGRSFTTPVPEKVIKITGESPRLLSLSFESEKDDGDDSENRKPKHHRGLLTPEEMEKLIHHHNDRLDTVNDLRLESLSIQGENKNENRSGSMMDVDTDCCDSDYDYHSYLRGPCASRAGQRREERIGGGGVGCGEKGCDQRKSLNLSELLHESRASQGSPAQPSRSSYSPRVHTLTPVVYDPCIAAVGKKDRRETGNEPGSRAGRPMLSPNKDDTVTALPTADTASNLRSAENACSSPLNTGPGPKLGASYDPSVHANINLGASESKREPKRKRKFESSISSHLESVKRVLTPTAFLGRQRQISLSQFSIQDPKDYVRRGEEDEIVHCGRPDHDHDPDSPTSSLRDPVSPPNGKSRGTSRDIISPKFADDPPTPRPGDPQTAAGARLRKRSDRLSLNAGRVQGKNMYAPPGSSITATPITDVSASSLASSSASRTPNTTPATATKPSSSFSIKINDQKVRSNNPFRLPLPITRPIATTATSNTGRGPTKQTLATEIQALRSMISDLKLENTVLRDQITLVRRDWIETETKLDEERYKVWQGECRRFQLEVKIEEQRTEMGRMKRGSVMGFGMVGEAGTKEEGNMGEQRKGEGAEEGDSTVIHHAITQ